MKGEYCAGSVVKSAKAQPVRIYCSGCGQQLASFEKRCPFCDQG